MRWPENLEHIARTHLQPLSCVKGKFNAELPRSALYNAKEFIQPIYAQNVTTMKTCLRVFMLIYQNLTFITWIICDACCYFPVD